MSELQINCFEFRMGAWRNNGNDIAVVEERDRIFTSIASPDLEDILGIKCCFVVCIVVVILCIEILLVCPIDRTPLSIGLVPP